MSAFSKDEDQIWAAITKNEVIGEMLRIGGDQYHVAVRVKVVEYAEDVFVVWLAVGVRYVRVSSFK